MTSRNAITAAPILPVLAERWSPRSLDETYVISDTDLLSIIEAGRWAPSANNLQPWRFSVAKRDTDVFGKIAANLSGFNAAWSPRAAAYVVISIPRVTADGSPYKIAMFDAGLTTGQILIQAQGMGLSGHVMAGIDHDGMHAALELPDELEVVVVVAIGKIAPADRLEGGAHDREVAPRQRHALDEIVLHGKP